MKELRGRVAILTGASRGIGVHVARALAREGVHLALAARSERELGEVRDEVMVHGVQAIAVRCDVTEPEDRARLVERATAELGPPDILVNNAGIERTHRFETGSDEDFVHTVDVNLLSAAALTRLVLPGMLERRRGHIVNMASGAGKVGVPFGSSYCASKHGLVGLSHALRAEYRKSGVGVSVVCPAFVRDSGMYARWDDEGIRASKIAGSSTPDKVADVVVGCIRKNKAEVLVNTPPVRPLVVLANMAPSIVPTLLETLGYARVFRRVAERSDPSS